MLTELAWHAVGCSSWNGYRCSEWWRYSSLRAGPVSWSILGSILSGRWGLCGGSTSLMMLGPARMAYIAWPSITASACYSLILVLARVGWRGGPGRVRIGLVVAHFSLGGERHMRLGPAN